MRVGTCVRVDSGDVLCTHHVASKQGRRRLAGRTRRLACASGAVCSGGQQRPRPGPRLGGGASLPVAAECDVCCGFVILDFQYVEVAPSAPRLLSIFFVKGR